ncbi:MAG: hypothetical protein WDM70_04110 [Nitrosomonadales bacterium]
MNAQIEPAKPNLNMLCLALANHNQLLKSGLTPFEAECATLSPLVVEALEASPPRVQENFGLFMQYQVKQFQEENLASSGADMSNVFSTFVQSA